MSRGCERRCIAVRQCTGNGEIFKRSALNPRSSLSLSLCLCNSPRPGRFCSCLLGAWFSYAVTTSLPMIVNKKTRNYPFLISFSREKVQCEDKKDRAKKQK